MRGSSDLMQQQIRLMSEVRDCWIQAKRAQPPPSPAAVLVSAGTPTEEGGNRSEWDA